MIKKYVKYYNLGAIILCYMFIHSSVNAQSLPNAADISRLKTQSFSQPSVAIAPTITIPKNVYEQPAPKEIKNITLILSTLQIKGVTVFSEKELADIYAPYMHKKISLESIWEIKNKIAQRYKEKGFFLATVYIPEQEIIEGKVRITVVEGHIDTIDIPINLRDNRIIQKLVAEFQTQNPPQNEKLESFILRLNDLHGIIIFGYLAAVEHPQQEGSIKLVLTEKPDAGKGIISFNNYNSRFLGPWRQQLVYQKSFIPLQETTLSFSTTIPLKELKYGSINQKIPLAPRWAAQFSTNYAKAAPGYTLAERDIKSDSLDLNASLLYQPIRQRTQNLTVSLAVGIKNSDNKALGTILSKDRIRTLTTSVLYNITDAWSAINTAELIFTRGLDIFGARGKGDADISRAEAPTNFTTTQINLTREQPFYDNFTLVNKINGQFANSPLFSSQEFSYGGASLGRAFDAGEISGDKGLSTTLELQYKYANHFQISITPFIFYDIGKTWNNDTDSTSATGASAGGGLRFYAEDGISLDLTFAQPLMRKIATPRFGNNGKNPVVLFEMGRRF